MARRKSVVSVLFIFLLLCSCVSEPIRPKANKVKAVQAYISAGTEYMRLGDMERATRHLSRALELNPKSPEAHNAVALLHQSTKDTKLAEKHFKKAIHYGSNYSVAENNYGSFLFASGRFEEAIKHLERAANDPSYENRGQSYENVGRCYVALKKDPEAIIAFDRSLLINPNLSRSYLELADIALQKKDLHEAKKNIDKFHAMTRKIPRSLWIGIQVERVLGDKNLLSSYELTLKSLYADSREFRLYQESMKKESVSNGQSGKD